MSRGSEAAVCSPPPRTAGPAFDCAVPGARRRSRFHAAEPGTGTRLPTLPLRVPREGVGRYPSSATTATTRGLAIARDPGDRRGARRRARRPTLPSSAHIPEARTSGATPPEQRRLGRSLHDSAISCCVVRRYSAGAQVHAPGLERPRSRSSILASGTDGSARPRRRSRSYRSASFARFLGLAPNPTALAGGGSARVVESGVCLALARAGWEERPEGEAPISSRTRRTRPPLDRLGHDGGNLPHASPSRTSSASSVVSSSVEGGSRPSSSSRAARRRASRRTASRDSPSRRPLVLEFAARRRREPGDEPDRGLTVLRAPALHRARPVVGLQAEVAQAGGGRHGHERRQLAEDARRERLAAILPPGGPVAAREEVAAALPQAEVEMRAVPCRPRPVGEETLNP